MVAPLGPGTPNKRTRSFRVMRGSMIGSRFSCALRACRRIPTMRHLGSGYEKKAELVGEFKSPIVKCLWEARDSTELQFSVSTEPVLERPPSYSRTTITYNFSSSAYLRESYKNPWGHFRKGRLFEDMDALAGTVAFKHTERDRKVPLLVTASVDRIRVAHDPKVEQDMEMTGQVRWTGRSSMVIQIDTRVKGDEEPWVNALFTFVARDPITGKAAPVNKVVPETEEEKRIFEELEKRAEREKQLRQGTAERRTKGSLQLDKAALCKKLLQQALPLVEMPCLADPACILIDNTRCSNTSIMQPQQRNMMNRIFGGFLMRRAYEIAFSTCYLFGGSRPQFFEVAHVDFVLPVDVGDLVRFSSCVLCTKNLGVGGMPEVHVQVIASICRPEIVESKVSNNFYFTFTLPEKASCLKVLPANMDQAKQVVERIQASLNDTS